MSELDNMTQFPDENDSLMPDGYAEGDDIFNVASWSGTATADTSTEEPSIELESLTTETEPAPATEQGTTSEPDADTAALEAELQAAVEATKLRFKTQYNHEELDVELDEADLPSVYQKSLALDSTREKLNKLSPVMKKAEELSKAMGYESVDAMLDSASTNFRQNQIDDLVADGVHKAVAEDIIDRKMAALKNLDGGFEYDSSKEESVEAKPAADPAKAPDKSGRDWSTEVTELMTVRPQLRGKELPKEVQERAIKDGKSLLVSYLEYESEQNRAEISRLKKANQVHEQNAASAERAPVTGVTGGGATDTAPSDPFLDAFNSVFG